VGLALLTDVTVGRDPTDVGLKAIIQKNLRDDTVVLAANARLDLGQRETLPAFAGAPADRRRVTRFEADAGASWRFRPNWSAALELRARDRFAGGGLRDQALYLGPTLHYGAQRWFLTASALARVAGRHRAPAGEPPPAALSYLAERTRLDGLRLRLGTTF
jgi:hypothetical protein